MILIGELSLWVALLMAAWATTVSFAGGAMRRDDLVVSGQRAIYAAFVLTVLASAGLWTALLTHDFSIEYVASTTSSNMPWYYLITAFWGGQAGSMLFWCLILSMYAALAVYLSRERNRDLIPWAAGTVAAVLLFFLATTVFGANPFTRLDWIPAEGRGMNPQLQNPGMAAHPPMLYLGYVATAIPFAYAVAALMIRRLDVEWLSVVRRWALLTWFFLTVGIVLGMWWAYVELGWAGYWAWDPVENSSFLPWLTVTAFLHSIMIQEKRGMLRKWNVVLVIMTFLLSILGTFITRSGIIESVHSFARSEVGTWFLAFLILSTAASIILVSTRLRDLERKVELESMVSREAAFLYNNLLLCGICFAVLWGTLFPILSEWVRGEKITVGAPFFNRVNIPLGLLLLGLTGVGPLIAWRRASVPNLKRQFATPVIMAFVAVGLLLALGMRNGYALVTYFLCAFVTTTILQEFYKGVGARRALHGDGIIQGFTRLVARNRRRYGGYIVHAGIVMLFAAFAGLWFRTQNDFSLRAGEEARVVDPFGQEWRFVAQPVSTAKQANRASTSVALQTFRDGEPLGFIRSERRQYFDSRGAETFEPVTEVGIHTTARLDTYVVLAGVVGDAAEFQITFNPLVVWVWVGGLLMAIGGVIVMWPQAERRRQQTGYVTVIPSGEQGAPALVEG